MSKSWCRNRAASADGFTTTAHADLFGYWWDYTEPSTSYIWVSNPIGIPGSVVSLQMVEILASNPTSTPATITISPTSPPGQSLYGNQNPVQQAVFTIPPLTSNFRGSLRLGYLDYNVCIRVDAANTDVAGAPILHELTYGIDRRPSAVR